MSELGKTHVVGLLIENTMGIELAELHFGENGLTIFAGENDSGKTSALLSVWFALGGKKAINRKPIRDGQEEGSVTVLAESVEKGRLVIERRFKLKKQENGQEEEFTTEVRVTGAKGETFRKPQSVLDALSHELSIDPTRFAQMDGKARREILLRMLNLEIDLDEWDGMHRTFIEERAGLHRDVKRLRGHADSLPHHTGLPAERPDPAAIRRKLEEAEKIWHQHAEFCEQGGDAADEQAKLKLEIKEKQKLIADLKVEIGNLEAECKEQQTRETLAAEKAKAIERPDIDAIKDRLEGVSEELKTYDHNDRYEDAQREAKAAEEAYEKAKDKVKAHEQQKADAFAKAEFPVEGLGVGHDDITYGGIPFEQVNSSKRIMIALEILARLDPELRLITCEQGSMLDTESRAYVDKFLRDNDFLALMEVVDDKAEAGIVFKEGRVVQTDSPAAEDKPLDAEFFEEAEKK